MTKLKTEETPGGAQQYVRETPEKSKARRILDLKHSRSGKSDPETTALSKEIMAAELGGTEAKAAFKKKYGVTPSKAENMIDAAFGTEIDKAVPKSSLNMEKFSQDLMKKEKRGMAMGGKVKTKGYAAGGRVRAGDVRFNNKRGMTY